MVLYMKSTDLLLVLMLSLSGFRLQLLKCENAEIFLGLKMRNCDSANSID